MTELTGNWMHFATKSSLVINRSLNCIPLRPTAVTARQCGQLGAIIRHDSKTLLVECSKHQVHESFQIRPLQNGVSSISNCVSKVNKGHKRPTVNLSSRSEWTNHPGMYRAFTSRREGVSANEFLWPHSFLHKRFFVLLGLWQR